MRKLTSLLVLACLLAACSPDPDPGPPPATTPAATASSTTPSAAASNPSTDPLYLEAVEVYKALFSEVNKAEMSGFEPDSLVPLIQSHATGSMLEVIEESYQEDRAARITPKGSGARLTAVAPNPGVSREGSLVSIRVCGDGSHMQVIDNETQKVVGKGSITYKEIYFKKFGNKLKGFVQDSEVVEKCPL